MKKIFETFKKSIYNPDFYQSVPDTQLSAGIRYYIKSVAILSLFMTVVLAVILIPQGVSFMKTRAPYLVATYYPNGLEIHIEKGVASANVAMPYLIPLKTFTAGSTSTIQNLLVIDTTHEFTKSSFDDFSTYALLTSTDIITRDEKGAITIQPLSGVPTTTVSEESLLSWIQHIQKYLWIIGAVGIASTFIIVMVGYLLYLIPLVLFALVPKIVAYFKKIPLSYSSAYKMSLYAMVPALALKMLLDMLGLFFLPEYFTVLVFMLIIVMNMQGKTEPTLFENSN